MNQNTRFHNGDNFQERIQNLYSRALENGSVTIQDIELIKSFLKEAVATSSLSGTRQYKIVLILLKCREYGFMPEYAKCTTEDVFEAVSTIRSLSEPAGNRFKQNTAMDYISILKRFVIWLSNNNKGLNPDKIKQIKPPGYTYGAAAKVADLPTEEDIQKMIDAAKTPQTRAILSLLWQTGCRIGDLGNLHWSDIEKTDTGIIITTRQKTNKLRKLPVFFTKYWDAFVATYKWDMSPDAFVFRNRKGLPLQYLPMLRHFRLIAERAGVEQRFTSFHQCRHAVATEWLKAGVPPHSISLTLWGGQSPLLYRCYGHLSFNDSTNDLFKYHQAHHKAQKLVIKDSE